MATKKLVPRATNEGGLGTALKVWGPSWLQNLTITNLQTSASLSVLVETAGNVEKRNAGGLCTDVEDTNATNTYIGLWEEATGCLMPKTDAELRYDALADILKFETAGGPELWIQSGSIEQFLIDFGFKVSGDLTIHSVLGKVTLATGVGAPILSVYDSWGVRCHLLQHESAPLNIITEAVPGGGTTIPAGYPGFLAYTPWTDFQPNLTTKDEGVILTATTTEYDFVGAGVTATNSGTAVTVTIPGGGGGTVADTEDTTCFVGLWESATGVLDPKTDEGLTYNALTGSEQLNLRGQLALGEIDVYSIQTIFAHPVNNGTVGSTVKISAGSINTVSDKPGGQLILSAGQGTGAASAGGGDSAISFQTYKDVAAGAGAQSLVNIASIGTSSKNTFRLMSKDASNDFLDIDVEDDGVTTFHTVSASGGTAYDADIKIYPRGYLYLDPHHETTFFGGENADTTTIQKLSNATNLPGGTLVIAGADAVGNYTGAGTASGGHLVYEAGGGTGTGPNGAHFWYLSKIFDSGNLGVAQVKSLTMSHLTDNDENSLLHLASLDASPMQLRIQCGQDRARIFTDTAAKTMELGCKTTDGSLIKFQDHTTTTYGDTLATVHSLRTESFLLACSDETSHLVTGTAKTTFRMPYAFTLTEVRASVNTAPTGSTITVDINEGGATLLTTKLTIDVSELTSTTAATPAVIGGAGPALADDSEITIDIDQVGSTVAGKGLKVTLIGYKTV